MLVIRLSDRAEQVFKLFAEFVKQYGPETTLGELIKKERYGNGN